MDTVLSTTEVEKTDEEPFQDFKNKIKQVMERAQQAADSKDQYEFFKHMRQLAPKTPFKRIILRDDNGQLMGPIESADALAEWLRELYAGPPSNHTWPSTCWPFLPHQMKRVFMTFSISKAVAPSFLPSIFWREHAELASQLIDQRMQNLRQHSSRRTPQEWSGSHVVLLPKPGKSSAKPSNLRPISLLEASGKAAMGALASGLISQLWHHLCGYPQ